MTIAYIIQLRNGDHVAFNYVYQTWKHKVYGYFLKLSENEETAKDLTQLTFLKVWKYHEKINPELNIDTILFRHSRQVYIDWLRKQAVKRKHISSTDELPEVKASPTFYRREEAMRLEKALAKLSPRCREVFNLKHRYGYSYKEISEMLNISPKTVDNLLFKAVGNLRKSLSGH